MTLSLVLYTAAEEVAVELRRRALAYLSKPYAHRDRGFDLQVYCIGDTMPPNREQVLETRMTTQVAAKVCTISDQPEAVGYDLRFRSSMRKEYGWVGNLGTVDPTYSQPLLADIVCTRQVPRFGHTFPMEAANHYTSLHEARVAQIVGCDGRGFYDVIVWGPDDRDKWLSTLANLGQSEEGRGGFGSTGV